MPEGAGGGSNAGAGHAPLEDVGAAHEYAWAGNAPLCWCFCRYGHAACARGRRLSPGRVTSTVRYQAQPAAVV
jgi:hypothetical protein